MKCVHKINVTVRSNMLRIYLEKEPVWTCVYLFKFGLYIFLMYDAIATTD